MTKDGRGSLSSNGDISYKSGGKGEDNNEGLKVSNVVRILTVVAYIIGVSSAAALLSAYYIFVWVPHPTEPMQRHMRVTDSPFTLPQHGNTHLGGSSYHYPKNSYSSSMEASKHVPHSSRVSKKASHYRTTMSPHLPKPQYLVGQRTVPTRDPSLNRLIPTPLTSPR